MSTSVRFKLYGGKNHTYYVRSCEPWRNEYGIYGVFLWASKSGTTTLNRYSLSPMYIRYVKYNGKIYDFKKFGELDLFYNNIMTELALDNLNG